MQSHYVPAHRGDPGNEAADSVAQFACSRTVNHQTFWDNLFVQSTGEALKWLWWLYQKDCVLHDGYFDSSKPQAVFKQEVCEDLKKTRVNAIEHNLVRVQLKIASYNINTIDSKGKRRGTVSKIEEALRKFHEAECHVVVLQETRHRKNIADANPWYSFVQCLANDKGQGGIIIALSRFHKIGTLREERAILRAQDVRLLQKTQQHLLVKIDTLNMRTCFLAAHAPHTGHTAEEVDLWWKTVGEQIHRHAQGWPLIAAIDANARLGSIVSKHIGSHQSDEQNWTGDFLHDFVTQQDSWIPATFEHCQVGDGSTFVHPAGKESRIDFITLPLTWKQHEVQTRVAPELATSDHLFDHKPILLELKGPIEVHQVRERKQKQNKLDLSNPEIRNSFRQASRSIPRETDWQVDVHADVFHTTRRIHGIAVNVTKHDNERKPRKSYFQEDTWQLIKTKQNFRRIYFSRKWHERRALLLLCMETWKGKAAKAHHEKMIQMRREGCQAESIFRQISKNVTKLVRRDDQAFYDSFTQRMLERESKGMKEFWAEIKRYLPRFRSRRKNHDPGKIEILDAKWEKHMAEIEAAVPQALDRVYLDCIKRQNVTPQAGVSLQDLPGLPEIEHFLRKSQPNKACGPDQISGNWLQFCAEDFAKEVWVIAMKTAMWQTEAIQFKGGNLVMIPKGGNWLEPSSYRPIMLMSVLAKQIHAWYRPKLIQSIEQKKAVGQIGGFPGQEPTYGSHFIRGLQKIAYRKGYASGVVFLDLKTAFHSLIRQLVFGHVGSNEREIEAVRENMKKLGIPLDEIDKRLEEPGYFETIDAEPALICQMREFCSSNWANLYSHELLTCKGTRPGSPVADIIFHAAACEITLELTQLLQDDSETSNFMASMAIENVPIAWADDIAMFVVAQSNDHIEAKVASITQSASRLFQKRGMQMNFERNKTEAIVTFVGKHASKHRKQQMQQHKDEQIILDSRNQEQTLKFSFNYKHLGTIQETAGNIKLELQHRVAEGWAAWRSLSRPLLLNRKLSVTMRLRLWECLVLSKIFYGAGAWPLLSRQQLRIIEIPFMKMIRSITNTHFKHGGAHQATDQEVLCKYGITPARIRMAKERLNYAHRLFKNAFQLLGPVIQAEFDSCDYSWQAGFEADLRWLSSLLGNQWGNSFQEACKAWGITRNWKSVVKRAVNKFLYQEEIAYHLMKGAVSKPSQRIGGEFRCACGSTFPSGQALSVHKWKMHQEHNEEYVFVHDSICRICLRDFWDKSRNRQHLTYIPQNGKPNLCFSWFAASISTGEHEVQQETEEDTSVKAHKGLNRREALNACGPHVFGFRPADLIWAEDQIKTFETYFSTFLEGLSLDDVIDEDDHLNFEAAMQKGGHDWLEELLCTLESTGKSLFANAFNLTLWWGQRQRGTLEENNEIAEVIKAYEAGPILLEWFDVKLRYTRAQSWRSQKPHRAVNLEPVNDSERLQRDKQIELTLHRLIDHPEDESWELVSPFLRKEIVSVLQPNATIALHRKVKGWVMNL